MSEDHTMDKKNRSSQSQNKGNGSESKKLQDVTSSKQFPKQSKRREPAGSIKNEGQGRSKPQPQKPKQFDKRPKPRGGFAGGKESTKVNLYDRDQSEYGSLYSPGSKKQNLNHLLNFQYASHPSHYGSRNNSYSSSRSHGSDYSTGYTNYLMQSLASVHKHKYNKEQFLQANCQFIVRSGEDYTVHLGDPDTLVKWDFIQQIKGFGNEDIKCPICLDLPRAPQLTRCGHCFCWPCILHYLALSDKSWRKCPICYEAVHLGDLKSFQSVTKNSWSVDEVITFQLMKRERGSMVVSPVEQWELHSNNTLMNFSESLLDTSYAKLLSATLDDILKIIDIEENDLTLLLQELKQEQCPTLCFTERALELLQTRRNEILKQMQGKTENTQNENKNESELSEEIVNQQLVENQLDVQSLTDTVENQSSTDAVGYVNQKDKNESISDAKLSEQIDNVDGGNKNDNELNSLNEEIKDDGLGKQFEEDENDFSLNEFDTSKSSNSKNSMSPPNRFFYFYQATDGQQIFLNAVNVRMLEYTYGSLEFCPHTLTGRILEIETGSMTEDLRRRLRYLQHLPVTCQFEVVEIELKTPIVSEDAIYRYKDQLATRERRRVKRAREDKRRAARIEEVEYVQLRGGVVGGASSRRRGNLHIDSHLQFPECGVGGVPGLYGGYSVTDHSTESSRASSPRRPDSPVTMAMYALSLEQQEQQPVVPTTSSFSQRLRAGSSLSAGDNSIFWPSVGETNNTNNERRRTVSEETQQLATSPPKGESSNIQQGSTSKNNNGANTGGQNKKKKRKQQTLLFTTGGLQMNK